MTSETPTTETILSKSPEDLLRDNYASFVGAVADTMLDGTDPKRTIAGYMETFLEQNAGSLPEDVVASLSDKRLALIKESQRDS